MIKSLMFGGVVVAAVVVVVRRIIISSLILLKEKISIKEGMPFKKMMIYNIQYVVFSCLPLICIAIWTDKKLRAHCRKKQQE